MGEYTIPGFLSGKNYRFTIAGDQPSPTEMQRMQGILQRDEMAYKQEFEGTTGRQIPYDPEAGTAISRGLERGIPQFQSALGSAASAAGLEGVGEYLKGAAQERQKETLSRDPGVMESADFRNVRGLSSGLTYAGELTGEQLMLIGGTVAATGAGALAGLSTPVAAGLGTLLVSYPQLFGSNIQRQEGQVAAGALDSVDVPKAALSAIGQTALEAASNMLLVGQAGKGLGRALLTNIPAEASTEVGQQVLERKQAGLDLDSEDAYREYLDAGVAGGTLGGIFGGVGALTGRRATTDTPLQLPPPSEAEREQFDDDPIGRRPGPDAGSATIVGTTRVTSSGSNETRVRLTDGHVITMSGDATQAEIDAAVNAYRSAAQSRTPPPGVGPTGPRPTRARPRVDPNSVEDAEIVPEPADLGPMPDISQPITTRTLTALGIPSAARTYKRFASDTLSPDEAITQLQSFADAAVADGRPDLQPAARRTLKFIESLQAAKGKPAAPVAKTPTLSEAEAFELAAAASVSPAAKADVAKATEEVAPTKATAKAPVPTWDTIGPGDVVTLYRGEGGDLMGSLIDGRWWTTDPDKAALYGEVREFTAPAELIGRHAAQGHGGKDEFFFPDGLPELGQPAAKADAAKATAQTEMDLGPVVDPDAVIEDDAGPTQTLTPSPRKSSPSGATVEPEVPAAPLAQPNATREQDDGYAEALMRYDTLTDALKNKLSALSGFPREGNALVGAIVDEPSKFQTLMDQVTAAPPAQPDVAPDTPARQPMTGATPGAELGTAGQTIPSPIAPAVRPAPRPTPQATPRVPEDPVVNRALENRIAEKFIATASPELQTQTRALAGDAEPLPTTAKDKTAVLALLDTPPAKPKGRATSEAYSAYVYFKNYPDVGAALHAIMSDFVAIGESSVPKFRSAAYILGGEPMTPQLKADLEVYTDTGTEPAKRATAWVRKNLSPETRRAMESLAGRYRPLDYEAASEAADARKAAAQALSEAESDQFDISPRPISDTGGVPLHPRVVQYLRDGNLTGALRNLRITSADKYAGKLADKMRSALGDTKVRVVPDATMARIEAVMRPGRTPDPRGAARGVYIPTMTSDAVASAQRQGRTEAIDIAQQYGGSILINETSGRDATTLLHEASHAVLDRVTRNPSHPLTRQLTTLMSKIVPHTPPGFNGAENLKEFLAEGLTDQEFHRVLSRLNPDGAKFSAWEMFTNTVKNFFRRLLGAESKPLGSAADVIDRALDTVIAANPADRGAGDIMGSSFRPLGARNVLRSFKDRVVEFVPADMQEMRDIMRSLSIPKKYKEGVIWLSMPLDYISDAASRYFPNTARTVHDLVNQHRTEKQDVMDVVTESLVPVNEWIKTNLEKISTFNDVRFTATRFGADPRKDRAAYEGYAYQYNVVDPVTGDVRQEVSPRYVTKRERNAAMRQHDRVGLPGHAEAYLEFSEDPDQLAAFDEIMPKYRSLGPLGRKAMDTLFVIPEVLTKFLAEALQTRLAALLPGNLALQERIYSKIYDKVFRGNGVTPYQSLSRVGDYALSYYGADPKQVELDADGVLVGAVPEVQYWTHSFTSARARKKAIQLLKSQPAAFQIDTAAITPYQQADPKRRQSMPLEMVSKLLSSIDATSELGEQARDSILEMVLDTAPESSFMQMFRTRKGTRGFIGDVSPIEQGLTAGDTLANIRENSLRLAGNIVDIKFGAKFAKARLDLTTEYKMFGAGTDPDPLVRAKDAEEAKIWYDALMSYTTSVFRRQGEVAQTLNTAAYGLTLGANISSALLQLSSVPVYVFPFLAGQHGGKAAMQAIGHATRLLSGTGSTRSVERITSSGGIESFRKEGRFFEVSIDNLDLTDAASPMAYMKALQDSARLNGLVGRSLTQDLTAGENLTGSMVMFKKVVAVSGVMQSTVERLSREMTAVAKYHLALKDMAKASNMGDFSLKQTAKKLADGTLRFTDAQYAEAAKVAMDVAEKTNGPMFSAAGPQAAQSDPGSILFLFKKHSLAMYNLLYQTMMRSLASKEELAAMSVADRAEAMEDIRIARYQLGGMMGGLALTSGALGLPLAQQLGWIYDAFADDDEEDFKTMTRTAIGEYGAYGLLDYLTGIRLSERIGLGAPFYRAGLNTADTPLGWQIVEGIGGPVVGLSTKYVDRVIPLLMEGDLERGVEAALPSAVANLFRAARYSQEGILTRRGDAIVDDITPASVLAQAIGFMPAAYARQLDQNAALSRMDNAIREERSSLLSMRYQAYRNGDRVTFREVEQQIEDFNRRHPGKAEITPDTKDASLKANMKTTSRMHHGVNLSDQNIRRAMELANQYGPATVWE